MNIQKIIVAVGIVLVLGAVVLFSQKAAPDAAVVGESGAPVAAEKETASELVSGVGSFTSLLGLGQNLKCDFSFDDGEGASGEGTSYITKDRMRVDSTMVADGVTYDSHMINDGEYIYTWTTGGEMPFAIKMQVPEDQDVESADDAPLEERGVVTGDEEVNYDCDRWSVDALKFVPPSDVEFMDMESMFKDMMQNMPEGFEMPEGFPQMQ